MAKKEKQEAPMMIVSSKMKEYAKTQGVRVSGEFADNLNNTVARIMEEAVRRCKGNGRQTVRPDDL